MYVPKRFENADQADVLSFIEANGFATLISHHDGLLSATHTPLQLSDDRKTLLGHISKANPQWKSFTQGEALAIFTGPHAYISSSWYDHENVPTWNYIAVHVYGTINVIQGEALLSSLKNLVDKYERQSVNPVSVEKMSEGYLQSQLRGLVGFELSISRIEASYKLSQNRDEKNFNNIIAELEKRDQGNDSDVAEAMLKYCPHHQTKPE